MTSNSYRRTDEWGRVVLDPRHAFELAQQGYDIWSLLFDPSPILQEYNDMCREWDKTEFIISQPTPLDRTPEEEHQRRISTWMMPEDFQAIPVREFLLSMCRTEIETARVNEEMNLFEERGLERVLQLMIYLVDHFRQRNIVWGVGRGSSVASYCLYLIGVHKIDSIKYGLEIGEFLK